MVPTSDQKRHRNIVRVLLELERLGKKNATPLPERVVLADSWRGVGFKVGDTRLISRLTQVSEILHYPPLTHVPGSQSWVKGIANIRGVLLPILDLRCFLGNDFSAPHFKSRVLVIHYGELTCGLLVDQVLGLKHLRETDKTAGDITTPDVFREFVSAAYSLAGKTYFEFDLHALAQNPRFYQVAA